MKETITNLTTIDDQLAVTAMHTLLGRLRVIGRPDGTDGLKIPLENGEVAEVTMHVGDKVVIVVNRP